MTVMVLLRPALSRFFLAVRGLAEPWPDQLPSSEDGRQFSQTRSQFRWRRIRGCLERAPVPAPECRLPEARQRSQGRRRLCTERRLYVGAALGCESVASRVARLRESLYSESLPPAQPWCVASFFNKGWSGGTGRRTGLKIPRPSLVMRVRPPPPAPTIWHSGDITVRDAQRVASRRGYPNPPGGR